MIVTPNVSRPRPNTRNVVGERARLPEPSQANELRSVRARLVGLGGTGSTQSIFGRCSCDLSNRKLRSWRRQSFFGRSRFQAVLLGALVAASAGFAGCGYTIGNAYQRDIATVYVPIFKNEDFRRGLEIQLTEAVQKQIQQRTPFRLCQDESADTKLTGTIKSVHKNVMGLTKYNDPRELQIQYAVEATWEDLRTGRILAQQQVKIEPEAAHLASTGEFAPEVGQSLATATQVAIDKMARRIVDMMQAPW